MAPSACRIQCTLPLALIAWLVRRSCTVFITGLFWLEFISVCSLCFSELFKSELVEWSGRYFYRFRERCNGFAVASSGSIIDEETFRWLPKTNSFPPSDLCSTARFVSLPSNGVVALVTDSRNGKSVVEEPHFSLGGRSNVTNEEDVTWKQVVFLYGVLLCFRSRGGLQADIIG